MAAILARLDASANVKMVRGHPVRPGAVHSHGKSAGALSILLAFGAAHGLPPSLEEPATHVAMPGGLARRVHCPPALSWSAQ